MIDYVIKRILFSIPTVIAVVLIVFLLIHIAPGNPVDILVGENASAVLKTKIEKEYALDRPVAVQALFFVRNVFLKGGGKSIYFGKPCFSVIGSKFKNTLFLGSVVSRATSMVCIRKKEGDSGCMYPRNRQEN